MTCVRGIGLLPMTAASFALGCKGLMNAGFGARFLPEEDFFLVAFLAAFFRAAGRRADFLVDFFLPAVFLLVVAIASLPDGVRTVRASEPSKTTVSNSTQTASSCNRQNQISPLKTTSG
jgi:hypothetical protein